ncbi:MAG: 2-oxoglutarate dehydrogenase complex dihydrolipoyllysine-residue succinyltransferase [Leptolyngbya sp. PLA1]|nr:2-oxoglutarate dehydrogenase complex dihydrolipoyllysine-residue succinyltransferase [Leptolyngbya sp. PLA1]
MAVDIVMPQAGESVTSGVISRWLKNEGDYVRRDEEIVEVETDKVNLAIPAPAAGVLQGLRVKQGDTVNVGQALASIDDKAQAPVGAASQPAKVQVAEAKPAPQAAPAKVTTEEVRATPLARKVAEEKGVDISRIQGTGAGGRVREQDVLAFSSAGAAPSNGAARPAVRATRERMTPLRQRIAQRLVQAQHTAAMLTTFNECDMTAVMELRKSYKEDFEKKHGIGLGFMSFFVKACVSALRAFPLVNASIVDDDGHPAIERHDTADIAVAVSTPKGLVVPVMRDCASLSFAGIESTLKDLAARGRDGKLSLEDMQGGTFTITNGGIFGSLMSTPILNPPQSAILGMHAIKNRPVEYPAGSGQVAIRPMMYLALSYDHRIVDGAEAVQFLVHVKRCLEDPQRLLLGV